MSALAALSDTETMPHGRVTWRSGGGVALLTLTNPPANGYSYEMMQDLDRTILRARMDDLRALCDELLRREMKRGAHNGSLALSMEAERMLQLHGWPGNVRELEQALRAAASRAGDGVIRPEHLPDSLRVGDQDAEDLSLKPAVRAFRLRYVQRIIEDKQGDLKAAAKALGVHPKYIYKLLRDMED